MLEKRQVPANLHFQSLNPHIDLEDFQAHRPETINRSFSDSSRTPRLSFPWSCTSFLLATWCQALPGCRADVRTCSDDRCTRCLRLLLSAFALDLRLTCKLSVLPLQGLSSFGFGGTNAHLTFGSSSGRESQRMTISEPAANEGAITFRPGCCMLHAASVCRAAAAAAA